MKGGKLLNVSISTISHQDKKLADTHLFPKWKSINWHQVEKSVNKLHTRITKAVIQTNGILSRDYNIY
jgi:RNA-directed DNA polymerase